MFLFLIRAYPKLTFLSQSTFIKLYYILANFFQIFQPNHNIVLGRKFNFVPKLLKFKLTVVFWTRYGTVAPFSLTSNVNSLGIDQC